MSLTLTPAYGRDYASKAACEADLLANKDFAVNGFMTNGRYANLQDLQHMGESQVRVRYSGLRKQFTFKVPTVPAPRPA